MVHAYSKRLRTTSFKNGAKIFHYMYISLLISLIQNIKVHIIILFLKFGHKHSVVAVTISPLYLTRQVSAMMSVMWVMFEKQFSRCHLIEGCSCRQTRNGL